MASLGDFVMFVNELGLRYDNGDKFFFFDEFDYSEDIAKSFITAMCKMGLVEIEKDKYDENFRIKSFFKPVQESIWV